MPEPMAGPPRLASAHLRDDQLLEILRNPEVSGEGIAFRAHFDLCDDCLIRASHLCAEAGSEEAAASSLRAVNVASSRWQQELAQAGTPGSAPVEAHGEAWKLSALLGRSAAAEATGTALPGGVQSPLTTLFLGRRQTSN